MKITFKLARKQYIVTVNGNSYTFSTSKDACEFINNIRKEAA